MHITDFFHTFPPETQKSLFVDNAVQVYSFGSQYFNKSDFYGFEENYPISRVF